MVNIKETQRFFIWLWGRPEPQREQEKKEGIEHFCKQMIKLPFKEGRGGTPCPNKTFARVGNHFCICLQRSGSPSKVNMAWERCPGASCSLPAACQLGLSYFWDLVPSLEKQTVALTVIPNKTPSFCSLNHVFQKSCATGCLDAKCWVSESQWWGWGEAFHLQGAKVEISIALQDGFPCGQGNLFCPKRRPWLMDILK